jgi:hypothetical protein
MTITRLKRAQNPINPITLQTNLMKKIILLALVGTGLVVTMPFTAQAVDLEKIGQNLDREPNMSIAQYNRDRYRDSRSERLRQRPFVVYYRSRDDRRWIYQSIHYNRRDARRAANRLERRGYRTRILG